MPSVNPQLLSREILAPRFAAKVNKEGPIPEANPDLGPCHLWTGGTNPKGYGRFWDGEKLVYSHRWIMGAEDGQEVDHRCFVHACVRKSHLRLVPLDFNRQQGAETRGRQIAASARRA